MARGDETRSVRRDANLTDRQAVVLPQSRRFLTAQGNDQGVRTARALTAALGIGIEAHVDKLGRDNVKGTARAAQEAAGGGERNEDDTNKGYNEAFDQVEASNDLAAFANELPALLEKEGWADLPEDQAQARIDEYFSSQLEGINPDSVYGKIVAEGILKQNAKLLQVHRTFQGEKAQQERRIMIDNEMRTDYENNDSTLDHDKLMDRLGKLVPGPGGRLHYLESVFDLAEDEGDVAIIDSIPEFFPNGEPTGITDPKMEKLFDTARSKAKATFDARKKAADEKWELDNQTTLAKLHTRDWNAAKAGDARVLDDIAQGGELGPNGEPRRYTEEQQHALYKLFSTAHEGAADDALLLRDWVNGDGVGYSQNEVDAAHVGFVKTLQANMPEDIAAAGEEAVNDYIQAMTLERSVVNGKLPSVYRDQMGVNLSNPAKFKDAAEMYTQLEAQRPGFAETQIGNAQSAKLYAYNRQLAETNGDEDAAIKLMESHEYGRNKKFNTEIGKVNKQAVDIIAENGWSTDFASTSRLRALVDEEVRFYVDVGFEPEQAGKFAIEHIARRTRRAGDHIYAPDAGWGNEPQAVYDWQIENEAQHRGIDADRLSIIPTGDPKIVRFHDSEATLPEVHLREISVLTEDYNRFNSVQEQARQESYRTSTSAAKKEAESRAFDTRYPPNPYGESGMRATMNKLNREAWAAMPAEQKQRLITDEMK